MRTTIVLALLGAANTILANAQPKQLLDTIAVEVAVRHIDVTGDSELCQVDACSNPESQATALPAIISEAGPESQSSWSGVNTTVTVEAVPWSHNTTNTPATPLPTEDPDTTDSEPAEVTGGALPQPMKASAAGLLGFFIMSLVML